MGRKLNISPGELSRSYERFLKKDERFNEYYGIIRKNTDGKIWIIGSYLYSKMLGELYGTSNEKNLDFDFLMETPFMKFEIPEGWTLGHTRFSDLKIERGNERIDFNSLTNIRAIIRKRIQNPAINDFLEGTPFNIDSIAYDLQSNMLVGNNGLEALRTRTLEVNDYESMKESKPADVKTMDFLKAKASGLEFRLRISPALRSIIVMDEQVLKIQQKEPPAAS